jgi:hypothetical protein
MVTFRNHKSTDLVEEAMQLNDCGRGKPRGYQGAAMARED